MSGLLLKELLIFKRGWKTNAILIVLFAAFSLMGNPTYFSSMMVMLLLLLPMSSFSSDELARWDKFAVALPGGRRAVVKSKYQFLFLVMGAAFVLACIVNLLVFLFNRSEGIRYLELVLTALTGALVGLLLNILLYPFLFKYGSQKARLMLGLVFGIAFAAVAMGMMILNLGGSTLYDVVARITPYVAPVLLAVAVVVLMLLMVVISYRISCRIYDKKEF